MTKILISCAVAAALATTTQADFSFGDMFKDMKEAAISMSKDAKDSVESMKDGAVETSKSAERTVTNVSHDARDTSVKVSDDLTLVTVRSALLLVSTAPSFMDSTLSLASLLMLIAASFMSLNMSPKLKSACVVVASAAATAHEISIFVITISFILIFDTTPYYHQNFKIKLKFYKNLSSKYVMNINRIELFKDNALSCYDTFILLIRRYNEIITIVNSSINICTLKSFCHGEWIYASR
ncbi:MAG: hypothetical protein LGB01_06250 [Sulfurovum sp.]|nr:hypothetical protein [Sulfurovum sp.]